MGEQVLSLAPLVVFLLIVGAVIWLSLESFRIMRRAAESNERLIEELSATRALLGRIADRLDDRRDI